MTHLLIRLFIKDYGNIQDSKIREKYGLLGSTVGIVSNILLFVLKLMIGTFSGSISIVTDAMNNLSDVGSSLVTLIGFKMGNKPADQDHPFGHGRIEYISALIISFIIMLVGFEFAKSSVDKIFHPQPMEFSIAVVCILLFSIVIKLWQSLFNKKIGILIDSEALQATALDSLSDVVATTATMISLFVYHFGNVNVDGYIGILVSVLVFYAGFSIARETLNPLIGEAVDQNLAQKIKEEICSYQNVLGVHDLVVHNYGPGRSMAIVHVEVAAEEDVIVSHELIDKIERELYKKLNIPITIHMDPIRTKDPYVNQMREQIAEIIHSIDPTINMHDFRIVEGSNQINLIFDIEVTYNYTDKEISRIITAIRTALKAVDTRFHCVIDVDKSYIEKK